MSNNKMKINISSPPDRKNLVAEIFFGDEQWAEINQENDKKLTIEFYPNRQGDPWIFEYSLAVETIAAAAKKLVQG